ncbi:hypothetical protein L3V82_03155 [Thiotrichales bacterium 19S3-7]|nr:hypothetical protein [Thiotrichales bacterium 19S3-7]MCF6801168.1 hypothetical protein [Thiotrichales bacterium 19S3-11]
MLDASYQNIINQAKLDIEKLQRKSNGGFTKQQNQWLAMIDYISRLFEKKIALINENEDISGVDNEINQQFERFRTNSMPNSAHLRCQTLHQQINTDFSINQDKAEAVSDSLEVSLDTANKLQSNLKELETPKEVVVTTSIEDHKKKENSQDYTQLTAEDAVELIRSKSDEDLRVIVLAAAKEALKNFDTYTRSAMGRLPFSEHDQRVTKAKEIIEKLESEEKEISSLEAFEALGKNGEHWNSKSFFYYESFNRNFVNLTIQKVSDSTDDFGPIAQTAFEIMHPPVAKSESIPVMPFQEQQAITKVPSEYALEQ